jgi:hypothetical protein
MAISPIVQQHQQSIIQQSDSPDQYSFNKEFGDAAYDLLAVKFPKLVPHVVTFKVIDQDNSDEEAGGGVGVFIVEYGEDVGYVPVVMSGGSIVSCEMIYDKEDDSMFPLIPKKIKHLVSQNLVRENELVKNPTIEDTGQLYKNMFRPPISSRPVLASANTASLVESLPVGAKKELSDYFLRKPEVLAKVAEFYPIEILAERLSAEPEVEKQAELETEAYRYLDNVIRLEDLTKEAAELLTEEIRVKVLDKGYAVDKPPAEPPAVLSDDELPEAAEKVFKALEWDGKSQGAGKLVHLAGTEFICTPCLLMEGKIFTREGVFNAPGGTVIVADFQEDITHEALDRIGAFEKPAMALFQLDTQYTTAVPTRRGTFRLHYDWGYNVEPRKIGSELWVDGTPAGHRVCFTPEISVGSIHPDKDTALYPMQSRVKVWDEPAVRLPGYIIKDSQALLKAIQRSVATLQLKKDAGDYNLINRFTSTTVKFASEPEFVNHLVEAYGFDDAASETLLTKGKVHLVKHAYQLPMGSSEHESTTPLGVHPGPAQAQGTGMGEEDAHPVIDETVIEDMAEFADPEMMDVGMVGSLAYADDIKSLLVDSLGSFEEALTELGKAILLFSINKNDMEKVYGRERYSGVVHRLRTGFTTLGSIVFDLKEYVDNTEYSAVGA